MIEITLLLHNKELDLAVSDKLTLGRLRELVRAALQENGFLMPEDFRLKIKDKQITVRETDVVSDFGLAGGDRLEIVLGEEDAAV